MNPENYPKSNPGRDPDVADAARAFEAAFQKRLQDEGWERKIAAGVFEQKRAVGQRWSTALAAAAGLFLTLGVFYGWGGGWMSQPDSAAPDAGWTALWALELEDQESLVFDGTVEEELTILAAFDD